MVLGSFQEMAEEILQETFVKIWLNAGSYDETKGKLYTWMLNIARNHAIDKLRSKTTADRKDLKKDKEFVEKHGTQPEQFTDGIGLRKLIDHLEEDQKVVIDLLYFQGFTQVEAAEQLNIPLGTVKSRVRIAIHKLRKYFV